MKKSAICMAIVAFALSLPSFAQNYDESKVPSYRLPDLLICQDGTRVTTARLWEKKRRPEVMEMFQSQMFGRTPQEKIHVEYTLLQEDEQAFGGKGTMRQVRFRFSKGTKTHDAILLLAIPNVQKEKKVPVIFCYNFKGNHNTTKDERVLYPASFPLFKQKDDVLWIHRGLNAHRWDYERVLDRGYALATMCYHDIYPDDPTQVAHSVAALFDEYDNGLLRPDSWQSIGAWAWGASRVADYLCTQSWVNKKQLVMMGHSRLGKTSLWAGAQDTRFKVVISNDSGCGGAALSRRCYGETVESITRAFPHWFCPSFRDYANREDQLPFDQHELLALVAPRALYVASAEQDHWADQKGEFLSAYHAGEVWQLYGLQGLGTMEFPGLHQPIMHRVGYHIRAGVHDVTNYDWARYLDFCDLQFGKK